MMTDQEEQFRQLIDLVRDIFPENAEYRVFTQPEWNWRLNCEIEWQLNDAPLMPNRPSRRIIIRLASVALEDYMDLEPSMQQAGQRRFRKFIETQFSTFDPNNNPRDDPPRAEWVVPSDLINH